MKRVDVVVYGLSSCPQLAVILKVAFSKHSKVAYLWRYGQVCAVAWRLSCMCLVWVSLYVAVYRILVSSRPPSNLHLRQELFPLMGLVSRTVYYSGVFLNLYVRYERFVATNHKHAVRFPLEKIALQNRRFVARMHVMNQEI